MTMNKYRLSPDVYNRKYDKEISREEIHHRLVGEKTKEIIDDEPPRLEDKHISGKETE